MKKATHVTEALVDNEDSLIPTCGVADTLHIGVDDLPWMPLGGMDAQVLQIDLAHGQWIIRARLHPGTAPGKHYHTGTVLAVTSKGRWWYEETPEQVNSAGSYLFEPAMSMHTLVVPEDQEGTTEIWFCVNGANIDMDDDGGVCSILDANTVLKAYRRYCESVGASSEKVIVIGENLL
jgi:hypothetical protein